jgi:hypothetical protein
MVGLFENNRRKLESDRASEKKTAPHRNGEFYPGGLNHDSDEFVATRMTPSAK